MLGHVRLFATPWTAAPRLSCPSLSPRVCSNSCPLVMPSNCLILCHSLLLMPSIFPNSRVFSSESALHSRWPQDWSVSFSISPFNKYSGLISFRIDWFYLLRVQGTVKSLFQHHSSNALILWCSAFFMVQLSHPYMTTGKTISSVQLSCSFIPDSMIPWIAACQASLSITNSCSLLKLMSIESVIPYNHLILCHPLLSLP